MLLKLFNDKCQRKKLRYKACFLNRQKSSYGKYQNNGSRGRILALRSYFLF